jgi:hypothetical protein
VKFQERGCEVLEGGKGVRNLFFIFNVLVFHGGAHGEALEELCDDDG